MARCLCLCAATGRGLDGPWCSDFRMLCMYIDFVCIHYRRSGLPLACAATGRGLDGLCGVYCSDFRMLCTYVGFVCIHYRRAALPLVLCSLYIVFFSRATGPCLRIGGGLEMAPGRMALFADESECEVLCNFAICVHVRSHWIKCQSRTIGLLAHTEHGEHGEMGKRGEAFRAPWSQEEQALS